MDAHRLPSASFDLTSLRRAAAAAHSHNNNNNNNNNSSTINNDFNNNISNPPENENNNENQNQNQNENEIENEPDDHSHNNRAKARHRKLASALAKWARTELNEASHGGMFGLGSNEIDHRMIINRVFAFDQAPWGLSASKLSTPDSWHEVLLRYPYWYWPARIMGLAPTSRWWHPLMIWMPLTVVYVVLAFFLPGSGLLAFDGKFDVAAFFNIGHCILAPFCAYRVFRSPLFASLVDINQHTDFATGRHNFRTRTLFVTASVVIFTIGSIFNALSLWGILVQWSYLAPRVEWVIIPFSIFFNYAFAYCLLTWPLVLLLLFGLVDDTKRTFAREISRVADLPDVLNPFFQSSSAPAPSLLSPLMGASNSDLPLAMDSEAVGHVEESIQQHFMLSELVRRLCSALQPMVVWKTVADFTLLVLGIARGVSHVDTNTYTGVVVALTSFVVVFVLLTPAAFLTSQYQSLSHFAARMLPHCIGTKRRSVESLIIYLQPFATFGGVHLLGVLITPQITINIGVVIYTLFTAVRTF